MTVPDWSSVPAFGLIFYTASEQRRLAAVGVQEQALQLAWTAATDQGQLTEGARHLLIALAQLPAVRGGDTVACSALFADLLKQYPAYADLGATKPGGDIFCSAVPLTRSVNYAERAWFQRTMQTRNFVVGDYQLNHVVGRPVLPLSYPVLDAAGQVQAVVFTTLDLVWLNELAAETSLPKGSGLTVIDRQGLVLARYPDPEKWAGQTVPQAPMVQIMLTRRKEGTAEAPDLDGISRLFAFTPLSGGSQTKDVYVNIGIPVKVAFAEVDRLLIRNLTGLGLVTLSVLIAAWIGSDVFILRRVYALLRGVKRLSAGDLSARTGLPYDQGELGLLAQSFDEMAASLEQRVAERERAEEEVHRLNAALEQRVIERTVQLEAANEELEAFSYSISHDLHAPLRALDGFSRILLEDYAPQLSPEARHYLHRVRDNAQQMGQLIDDLLTFSRLSSQPLKTHPLAPAELARQALADLRSEQENRHLDISIGELPVCQADPALLRQVFVNLLANALKFTRPRAVARIEVGCQYLDDQCIYFVKDNGVGFDMQYVHKLFGVFQRLHRAEEYEGTGVGLAIVQRIVHRHGGRVWAEAAVDKGATFCFTI